MRLSNELQLVLINAFEASALWDVLNDFRMQFEGRSEPELQDSARAALLDGLQRGWIAIGTERLVAGTPTGELQILPSTAAEVLLGHDGWWELPSPGTEETDSAELFVQLTDAGRAVIRAGHTEEMAERVFKGVWDRETSEQ